jgi:aldose 1-epimerase
MTNGSTAVSRGPYGQTLDGTDVEIFTLTGPLIRVKIISYGARVTSIETPDAAGERSNVVLGYADLDGYLHDKSYFGALVGRLANRLARGTFTLNGKSFQVPVNNGGNVLHGGKISFAQRVWTAEIIPGGVAMTLHSPDGEMGFPGNLTVACRYTLEAMALRIEIEATSDADTVVNLTNHAYFNLSGEGNGTVIHQEATIHADAIVPVNADQIPTGDFQDVAGTPFDFRSPQRIGARIDTPGNEQLAGAGGYDHTYVLQGEAGTLREAAKVFDPLSQRVLTVETTQPGVQFYTGNSLTGGTIGSNGKIIERRGGLCLETQHFPDSPNQPTFPSTVLKAGETFRETTIYRFSVRSQS